MTKTLKLLASATLALVLIAVPVRSSFAATVNFFSGSTTQVESVTGLDLGVQGIFDVTFVVAEIGPWFTANGDFSSNSAASVAAVALLAALDNSTALTLGSSGSSNARIPFDVIGNNINSRIVSNQNPPGPADWIQTGSGPLATQVVTIADFAISAVPLPAAFPLFAGGLGLLGLMGWRRKRKAAAATA